MKILVRGTNWIGDSVMSVPALRRLREGCPESEITLAAPSWAAGIYHDADFIDHLFTLDEPGHSPKVVAGQAAALRKHRFDAAVLFTNSFSTALVIRAAGIPVRVGYAAEGRGILLSNTVKKPEWKDRRHESFYYVNLVDEALAALDLPGVESDLDPAIPVSSERRMEARAALERFGVGNHEAFAVFGAGSTNSRAKRWPSENFSALAEALSGELGFRIVLVGSKDEKDVAESLVGITAADIVDITGKTSLAEAVSIISEASVMVCNDMGLAHVSAAVGTPTVTIFGPTNPLTTSPIGAEIVREQVECSPCMLRDCPIDHRCMTRVTVERVLGAVKKAIGSK